MSRARSEGRSCPPFFRGRRGWVILIALTAGGCGGDVGGFPLDDDGVAAVFRPALQATAVPPAALAEGRTGPGGQPFQVALRTTELAQYPCTSCHLAGRSVPEERTPDAHGNIRALHPSAAGGSCTLCHIPDRVDHLPLLDGRTAELDHSYLFCAGCHFSQAADWAGGAHGKRLAGWQSERVVANCTYCHDPHAPAFERRIPFPGPSLPTRGGRSR